MGKKAHRPSQLGIQRLCKKLLHFSGFQNVFISTPNISFHTIELLTFVGSELQHSPKNRCFMVE